MSISEEMIIWYPGIYHGRVFDEQYTQTIANVSLDDLVELVQKRAQEDGEWSITNGFVGDDEDTMRKMMEWVSNPVNITQCINHILKEKMENTRTVDFVCRDLANASKWIGGSRG